MFLEGTLIKVIVLDEGVPALRSGACNTGTQLLAEQSTRISTPTKHSMRPAHHVHPADTHAACRSLLMSPSCGGLTSKSTMSS